MIGCMGPMNLTAQRARSLCSALALGVVAALSCAAAAHAEPGHTFAPLTAAERQAIRAAIPHRARARPARPRRVLIFYRTEGYVHASIPFANEALRLLGEATGAYQAQASEDLAALSRARLSAFDAVILNNATHLSLPPEERNALLAFVESGKGLVGIHAASDSFYTWPEGQALLGGIFNSHPWTAADTVAVKLDDSDSPITAAFGGHGFWVKDEIYQIDGPYSREHVHVLLSLDMARPENARKPELIVRDDGDFPIAWIRHAGRGRVFYSSLGHNPEIYRTPQLLQHYLDGIQFALGDLAADATPSASLGRQPAVAGAPASAAVVLDEVAPPN
jgi:type 1 glutamine amidotransferase